MESLRDDVQPRGLFKVAFQVTLDIAHQGRAMTLGARALQARLAQGNRQAFEQQQVVGLGNLPAPVHVAVRLTEGFFGKQQMMQRSGSVPDAQGWNPQQAIGITRQITQGIAHVIRIDIKSDMALARRHRR
ncbi:hypothetical protein D3C73_1046580 [compost metagenome]